MFEVATILTAWTIVGLFVMLFNLWDFQLVSCWKKKLRFIALCGPGVWCTAAIVGSVYVLQFICCKLGDTFLGGECW